MSRFSIIRPLAIGLFAFCNLTLISHAQTQDHQLNADYFYFFNGQTLGSWGLTLGDASNWVLAVSGLQGESKDNQIVMSPATYKTTDDAINLKWSRKKGKGQFAIYGPPIDLTNIEHRAALTMEVKVITKPKKGVSIGVDCGYPCRGELQVHKMFRELEKDKWITVPIPLDCFSAKGLDVSKINAPIIIASEGKFEIELANIRMELLPEGTKTCGSQ